MDAHGAGTKLRCADKRALTKLGKRMTGSGLMVQNAESTHHPVIAMLCNFMAAGSNVFVHVNVTGVHAAARCDAARGSDA